MNLVMSVSLKLLEALKFAYCFTQRVKDCLLQNRHSKVAELSKAEHYKNYKILLNVEKYLSINISYKYRRVLAHFRCSVHELMIEKGRHLAIDRNFINCPICLKRNVYVIEDGFHFIMVCPEYEPWRYELFPYETISNIALNSFYNFMKTDDNKIRNLSKVLFNAFKMRKVRINEYSLMNNL